MQLSHILKEKRKELHLTQEDVSKKLHVTRQALSNWENGKNYPDFLTLINLCKLYHLSLDQLLKDDEIIMKKITKDTNTVRMQKKLRFLDIILIILIGGLLCFSLLNKINTHFMLLITMVIVLLILFLSLYRYWIAYPKKKGEKVPLFVPKAAGLGWSINPQNPIGLLIFIILIIIVIVSFLQSLI
ncbi:helix-turn-helix domain-containing protein [Ligilactobacillus sp. WILCCON 0076]|uniref:Helix-turn-helix domain-containing protein n=1 Tax=Ligilactobacillus ubinensis TaxID=2876789 RepID=A0A9X2JJQ9_9LACO|nr:helix-turn-helix domain-containing protein [Ligilactobacillus ubinensis]MCP0885733.1 helix-turn-helix domain-containing protein [Ligilactobacillus ubinensis]